MGRDDARELEKCLLRDSLCSAAHDRAAQRPHRGHQLHAGQRGEALHTHYGASKGAIISFVKGLATELARHNILVNCVAPGWVDTDMSAAVLRSKNGLKWASAAIPLNRPARAEEIAGPILFAASDLATFITGEVINVNGGAILCGLNGACFFLQHFLRACVR